MADASRLKELLDAFNAHDVDLIMTCSEGIPDVRYGGDEHWMCDEHAVSTGWTYSPQGLLLEDRDLTGHRPF